MTENKSSPETKSYNEAYMANDTIHHAFETYKETNDARLSQLEKRGTVDVVTSDKLARMEEVMAKHQAQIENASLSSRRPSLNSSRENIANMEHRSAYEGYMRFGEAAGLKTLETRAMSISSNADGGYLVPEETETVINKSLSALSPMRQIASVRQISSSVFKRPFVTTGLTTGWVAEDGARAQTNSVQLEEQSFPTMELYAMPAATQSLLDDNVVNLDSWLASEIETAFSEQEAVAFVSGNGTSQPKGFLSYTTTPVGTALLGALEYHKSGHASSFPIDETAADCLIDMIYGLKAPYRQNASFVMNRKTQAAIRKLKDGSGSYVWAPPSGAGENASLFGYKVVEMEAMPDVAAGSFPVAFGDFARGYMIVDRMGVRVLRDPYSAKPHVLFYTTKRVGGGVSDYDAIKLLKIAA